MTDPMLPDEACHAERKLRALSSAEMAKMDFSGNVILHNTMRFDVQLAHVYPMLADGDVDKEEIAEAIRDAIIQAVDDVLGTGLDGIPVPNSPLVFPVPRSVMLHRETICFDLS